MNVAQEYGLSAYQIDNLITLAAFLHSNKIPPPQFSISTFMRVSVDFMLSKFDDFRWAGNTPRYASDAPKLYHECGTVACAVGHGPLAGIPPLDKEEWHDYSYRVFGCDGGSNSRVFNFLFGSQWEDEQDSAVATARRIEYFLQHGIPEYLLYNPDTHVWMQDDLTPSLA